MAGNSEGAAKRGPGRPFAPGQSGNPSGRPKVAVQFRDRARAVVDSLVLEAWEAEVRDRGPHWLRASELLAAYGYGKPSPASDLYADAGPYRPLEHVSSEMIVKALTRLAGDDEGEFTEASSDR
jgi:hypothetical protein